MNKLIVSKMLRRFKHTDLDVILDNWSVLRSRNIHRSHFVGFQEAKSIAAKKNFIKTVVELTEVWTLTRSVSADIDASPVSVNPMNVFFTWTCLPKWSYN